MAQDRQAVSPALMRILDEVYAERTYQDSRWGHDANDTKNEPNDSVSFIAGCSTRWFPGGFAPYSKDSVAKFRVCMIKMAALVIAAIEPIDRQTAANGKPFYQAN